MELKKLECDLTVCKVSAIADIDMDADFYFIGKTDEEISLVCKTEDTPEKTVERDDGWKGFRIQGVLNFSLIGILSKLSGILADNKIGIFAVSTFNTDYILVKAENFEKALSVLSAEGYLNGMLTNEEVIQELLNLAKQIAAAQKEGDQLGLTADELAFYDALTKPQAIKDFYENEDLIAITKELADTLRKNRTIDWQKCDSARAKMRMMIKKLLKKHRYPPEGMDDAVQTVMTQCELWTDNADMEQREHKVVNYSFRPEQNLSMVAEEPAPYGKKD